ncbi:MAG: heme lyase CcmF/NrfE family subunit [Alphaproteobacteria bacterium]
MIAELGHFALILAFVMSLMLAVLPFYAVTRNHPGLMHVVMPVTLVMAAGVLVAFAALVWAFVTSDFSVALVASHSHSAKPMIYKISGTWGNHEGSLLLWIVILVVFAALLALRGQHMPLRLKVMTLGVQGVVSAAFMAFSLFTSNPFERLSPAPLDGNGLNPILQDPGLALHPPTLYVGYVGLSMAFSFAVAGLLDGRIDRVWAVSVRPWITAAWCALTAGIALGSWWAYYELGWGGWWFWDPVENASLMPWLAATALIHSISVVAAREGFKSWTVLLAIVAFSLSLVGTFIVRSGLLTSVHSFASDPARGVFILGILLVAIGVPLALFAWRGPQLAGDSGFDLVSREFGLLVNNFLLTAATIVVLIGTFYPLALEMINGARITVGPPYFDATFNPIMGALVVAMVVGPVMAWRRGTLPALKTVLLTAGLAAVVSVLAALTLATDIGVAGIVGLAMTAWLAAGILADVGHRLGLGRRRVAAAAGRAIPLPVWGMWCAHFGMVVFLLGALGNGLFASESVVRAKPGDIIPLAGKEFVFSGVEQRQGPNYVTLTAVLELRRNGVPIAVMTPENRLYTAERQTTTEAAIRPRISGDDYAVLGDGDAETGYTLRLYRKPLVSWVWAGAAMMAIGGLLAAMGRTGKSRQPAKAHQPPGSSESTAPKGKGMPA